MEEKLGKRVCGKIGFKAGLRKEGVMDCLRGDSTEEIEVAYLKQEEERSAGWNEVDGVKREAGSRDELHTAVQYFPPVCVSAASINCALIVRTSPPGCRLCDVLLRVYLSHRSHISKPTCPIFNKSYAHVTYSCGLVLLVALRYAMRFRSWG